MFGLTNAERDVLKAFGGLNTGLEDGQFLKRVGLQSVEIAVHASFLSYPAKCRVLGQISGAKV
jgi:hypothetical protein